MAGIPVGNGTKGHIHARRYMAGNVSVINSSFSFRIVHIEALDIEQCIELWKLMVSMDFFLCPLDDCDVRLSGPCLELCRTETPCNVKSSSSLQVLDGHDLFSTLCWP